MSYWYYFKLTYQLNNICDQLSELFDLQVFLNELFQNLSNTSADGCTNTFKNIGKHGRADIGQLVFNSLLLPH